MGQDILMWLSVVSAFGYTFYSFGKMVWNSFQEQKIGCTSGCGSCSAKNDLLKQINFKRVTKKQSDFKMIR